MTLQTTGPISFDNINVELGNTSSTTLSASQIQNSSLALTQNDTASMTIADIVFFKGYYYVISTGHTTTTGRLRRSTDMIAWETIPIPEFTLSGIVATSDYLILYTLSNSYIVTSTNGVTWHVTFISVNSVQVGELVAISTYGSKLAVVVYSPVYSSYVLVMGDSSAGSILWSVPSYTNTVPGTYDIAYRSMSFNGTEGQIVVGRPTSPGHEVFICAFSQTYGIVSPISNLVVTLPDYLYDSDFNDIRTRWSTNLNKFICAYASFFQGNAAYIIGTSGGGVGTAAQVWQTYTTSALSLTLLDVTSPPLQQDTRVITRTSTNSIMFSDISTNTHYTYPRPTDEILITASNLNGVLVANWYNNANSTSSLRYTFDNTLSQLYTDTQYKTSVRSLKLSSLYGRSNEQVLTNSAIVHNMDLRSWALSNGWNGNTKLKVINTGNIYSNAVGTPALTISGAFPGGVSFINSSNSTIIGMGGVGGIGGQVGNGTTSSTTPVNKVTPTAGGQGGTAILVSTACTIDNQGYIYGGGGGGGGGRAAAARFTSTYYPIGGGGGGGGATNITQTAGGSGGIGITADTGTYGGNGTSGNSGTPGTGGSRGNRSSVYGGVGGNGGTWGVSGDSGGTSTNSAVSTYPAAGAGGSGGAAISGNSNITWINTGTRLGAIQ